MNCMELSPRIALMTDTPTFLSYTAPDGAGLVLMKPGIKRRSRRTRHWSCWRCDRWRCRGWSQDRRRWCCRNEENAPISNPSHHSACTCHRAYSPACTTRTTYPHHRRNKSCDRRPPAQKERTACQRKEPAFRFCRSLR